MRYAAFVSYPWKKGSNNLVAQGFGLTFEMVDRMNSMDVSVLRRIDDHIQKHIRYGHLREQLVC